tara:strand:- start:140 stop:1024 length:885 start_codon:yes stop_codon:yes gene_type:complete
MKYFFIGSSSFSKSALKKLIELEVNIIGALTIKKLAEMDDHQDITDLCKENNIPLSFYDKNNPNLLTQILKNENPDVVFCLGWPRLLKKEVLNIPRFGVVGYHPAKLPLNRGRHPLIWTLALGLKESASTFFIMDEGADSGDIISQKIFPIEDDDYAEDIYKRITHLGMDQLEDIYFKFENGTIDLISQENKDFSYWRKRSPSIDGIIDWRMSAENIRNLVRALSYPYSGAEFIYKEKHYSVLKAEIVLNNMLNIEPGKVLASSSKGIIVKCGQDSVLLSSVEPSIELKEGEYL